LLAWNDVYINVFGYVNGNVLLPDGRQKPLFVYDLDLLVENLPGKPVDRYVHPVMLLAFDHEFEKISRTWIVGQGSGISHGLRDYVDKQVPSPRFE